MTEEINNHAKNRYGLRSSLAIGLVLFVGLITLGGCSKNGANSTTTPSPGTVVKNSIGMEFAYVPAGSFQMGSNDPKVIDAEPVHQVAFAKGFYMGRYEVTQAQWQKVMGSNPSMDKSCGENCPVDKVSWNDAQEFIKKLNAMNDGYTYSLPSEAEWEYACRAGTTGDYAGDLNSMAWNKDNSDGKLHPVGQKQPNAWGLYDMHGNVSEYVMDDYHRDYNGAPPDGSAWLGGGDANKRIFRGGVYYDNSYIRSADRGWGFLADAGSYIGLRVVAVSLK